MSTQESVYIQLFSDYVYDLIDTAKLVELNKVPSVALPTPHAHPKWGHIHNWCKSTFGADNYTWAGTKFYFRHEKDAVAFALRWL